MAKLEEVLANAKHWLFLLQLVSSVSADFSGTVLDQMLFLLVMLGSIS